jgi:hypothetical protein
MEVKLFFGSNDGNGLVVESHRLPEYTGRTITRAASDDTGADVTSSDADMVSDVIDTVQVNDKGVYLSRKIAVGSQAVTQASVEGRPTSIAHNVRIRAPQRMGSLERVMVDNEVVWPAEEAEAASEDPAAAALGKVSSQIEQLMRETA